MEIDPRQVFFLFETYFNNQFGSVDPEEFREKLDYHHAEIASHLWDLFEKLCNNSIEVETEETLYIDSKSDESDFEIQNDNLESNLSQKFMSQASVSDDSESPSFTEPDLKKQKLEADCYDYFDEVEFSDHTFSFETMKKIIQLKDEQHRTLKSIQNLYPKLHAKHITRFRRYIEAKGTFPMKMYELEQYIKNRINNSRKNDFTAVHDIHIRRWAIQKAREMGLEKFKASHKFVSNLKRRLRINSHKVTHLVTRKHFIEKETIDQNLRVFLELANSKLASFNLDFVLNSDQSGFLKEFHSSRTLSYKGEKHTKVLVNSIANTTHSYTIQPTITASGKLLSPMLICLQETTGNEFGPVVGAQVAENTPNNLVVVCSKSGKLTKEHVKTWLKDCLSPHMTQKSLLLTDSWSGQTDDFLKDSILPEKREFLESITIPAGTTGICQPLDVYFFRQYKGFVRRIYDEIMLEFEEVQVYNRLFFFLIHSLVHNQLTAEIFRPMLQYAWFKSGYSVPDPGKFKNVNEVCFNKKEISANCVNCENLAFMECAHCNKLLCLKHFLEKVCFH